MSTSKAYALAAAGALLAVSCVATGCAESEFDSCTATSDCPEGSQCVDGTCRSIDGMSGETTTGTTGDGGGEPRDAADVDPGGDGSVPDDGGGTGEDSAEPADSGGADAEDAGPDGCGGRCGIGERCVDGACVSACQPACRSDQQCADRGEGPKCYATCKEANSTKGCSRSGTRCVDIDPNPNDSNELLICDTSQCTQNADCQSGTCLRFVNDFGRCVLSGPKTVGDSCDLAQRSSRCEPGAFCFADVNSSQGTCRQLCEPWGSNPGCPSGSKCAIFEATRKGYARLSLRQGWCKPSVTSRGKSSLAVCEPLDAMCDDAIRCLGSSSPGYCYKWCRPGTSDCVGTMPNSIRASGVCNNYVLAGERRLGRCLPDCTQRGCPSGYTCVNKKCRNSCQSDSDCCDGSASCDWTCNSNGLCE